MVETQSVSAAVPDSLAPGLEVPLVMCYLQ